MDNRMKILRITEYSTVDADGVEMRLKYGKREVLFALVLGERDTDYQLSQESPDSVQISVKHCSSRTYDINACRYAPRLSLRPEGISPVLQLDKVR